MSEVLTHAFAFPECIEARRVHTGGAGNVTEFAVRPLGGGDHGLHRIVLFDDASADPLESPAGRRVVRRSEHLVEPVPDRRGGQFVPRHVIAGSFRLVGLDHR